MDGGSHEDDRCHSLAIVLNAPPASPVALSSTNLNFGIQKIGTSSAPLIATLTVPFL
jgi:hypothetical protein